MFRILVLFVVVITLPVPSRAAPTKRVVTLEAVFDSTDKRLSLNSKQIHGHYSRFMELSGQGNLCPRTITHLSDGSHYANGIGLPHREITHDGTHCQDGGQLLLKYERKLSSEVVANVFGLQDDVTGFKASIRRVLLSLDGFYIGIENVTRSCGRSSLANGAAVIITSDSEPFGKEFHIPFHGHPKVMLINDKHKACALTSTWGSPSPIPVQPTETQKSQYGPVSATISSSPPSPSSQPLMPSAEAKQTTAPTSSQVIPSSTPHQPNDDDNVDTSDSMTPASTPLPSVYDRESPQKKDTTTASTTSSKEQNQAHRSSPSGKMSPESPTATHASVTASEGEQSSTSVAASMIPTPPKETKKSGSAEETIMATASPSQSATQRVSITPSASATPKPASSEAGEQPYPSSSDSSPSPTGAPLQTFQSTQSFPEPSPATVLSTGRSPKPSIYPDASKAPKVVDMAPRSSRSPKKLKDMGKKGTKSSQGEDILLTGSRSPTAKPSTGGPLIFFGQKPSASMLPSPEVTSTPLVQESPSKMDGPEMTDAGASQSPKASIGKSTTPSPSLAVVAEEDGSACFPANAMAVVENGKFVRVEDLKVGNRVLVGDGQFSDIIDFSHADRNIVWPFDRFITASGTLTVTSSHYIYTQRGLLPAGEVSASDSLILSNGTQIVVAAKTQLFARGLFNPHTSLGDIIIDGFKASTYTTALEPTIAHALMAPIRLLDMVGSRPTLLGSIVQNPAIIRYFNIRSS
ncbi:sonic hedgehog protein precursor [Gracilaria domingensis]|nr:sonic hedgehog protein precursor [Gracilaria domingensis]